MLITRVGRAWSSRSNSISSTRDALRENRLKLTPERHTVAPSGALAPMLVEQISNFCWVIGSAELALAASDALLSNRAINHLFVAGQIVSKQSIPIYRRQVFGFACLRTSPQPIATTRVRTRPRCLKRRSWRAA